MPSSDPESACRLNAAVAAERWCRCHLFLCFFSLFCEGSRSQPHQRGSGGRGGIGFGCRRSRRSPPLSGRIATGGLGMGLCPYAMVTNDRSRCVTDCTQAFRVLNAHCYLPLLRVHCAVSSRFQATPQPELGTVIWTIVTQQPSLLRLHEAKVFPSLPTP